MAFSKIGILGHPLRPEVGTIVNKVANSFQRFRVPTWERSNWEAEEVNTLISESDLVIAIGGDGAMLRAARLCAPYNVPVFGINAGHLGFLTETSPDGWEAALTQLMDGHYWVEARMMVWAEIWRDEQMINCEYALNDVVVSRGAVARAITLDLYIDGGWATTYNVDGLIISTPTGSTAYALANGGPILPPELKNILIVPIAAHLSFDRSLVLAEGATVEVVVAPETQGDAALNVDGEHIAALEKNDTVVVKASQTQSRFIRLRERNYFYRSILDRMEPRMPRRRDNLPQPYSQRRGQP